MKIGMSTASLFTNCTTEDTFEVLREIGVGVCEVFLSSFSEYQGEVADIIVGKKSIDVHSVHALTNQFEPELFSRNPRAAADAEEVLRKVMTVARRLGARHYTFHGATMLKRAIYDHDYDRLGTVVNGIFDICQQYGVRLDYENVHWTYGCCPEYFANLQRHCPRLGYTLDIKQAMRANVDYRDFLKVMGNNLDTVHLCDYDENGRLSLPSRGSFDFVELFKRLHDQGFDGAALIEVYPQAYNDTSELRMAYEYILDCDQRAKG